MPEAQDRLDMAALAVKEAETTLVHQSVLRRISEIAQRLGCPEAARLGLLPALFTADRLPRLRRELSKVAAFADATRRTGWALGDLTAAPGDEAVPVLDFDGPDRLWVHPASGFEMHTPEGRLRVVALPGLPGTAERIGLPALMAPVLRAASAAVEEFCVREAGRPDRPAPGHGHRRP